MRRGFARTGRGRSIRKRRGGKKQGRRGRQLWQVVTIRLSIAAPAAIAAMVVSVTLLK